MENFTKVLNIGHSKDTDRVYIKVSFKDGKLSMTGVEGPFANGNCKGGCGQIEMSIDNEYLSSLSYAEGWNKKSVKKLLSVWRAWHLNDMRAGCTHQRKIDMTRKIELIDYSWSDEFYKMMQAAKDGKLTGLEYTEYQNISERVQSVTTSTTRPKYPTDEVKELLGLGLIKEGKKEFNSIGWVSEHEHPEGMLSKPCEICGHKYGSAWLKEDVPENVLEWLKSLPVSKTRPAWV